MNKRTKLILSVIGLAALILPAVLLLVLSSRTREAPAASTEEREVNARNIQDTASQLALQSPAASPAPASSSALPKSKESTSSSVSQ